MAHSSLLCLFHCCWRKIPILFTTDSGCNEPALVCFQSKRETQRTAWYAGMWCTGWSEHFSGVGNIIKNEVAFASVHPESKVGNYRRCKLTAMIKEARQRSFDFLHWKKRLNWKSIGWYIPKNLSALSYPLIKNTWVKPTGVLSLKTTARLKANPTNYS